MTNRAKKWFGNAPFWLTGAGFAAVLLGVCALVLSNFPRYRVLMEFSTLIVVCMTFALMYFQGFARDAAERRKREQSRCDSAEKYLKILEGSPQGIVTADAESTRIDFANSAICRMLGYSRKEFKELAIANLFPDCAAELAGSKFESLHRGESVPPLPISLLRKNGELLETEFICAPMTIEGQKYHAAFFTDIAERSRGERQASLSMKRLEGIFFLQDLLLLPAPLEEHFQMIVDTAVEMLDLQSCGIWMLRPSDLCDSGCRHSDDDDDDPKCCCSDREKCFQMVASAGNFAPLCELGRLVPANCPELGRIAFEDTDHFSARETDENAAAGCEASAGCLGSALRGSKLPNLRGETAGVFAVAAKAPLSVDDLSFLENMVKKASKVILDHETEEGLRQAQKLEGIGQLAGGIAHEFNNLLQVIVGYTRYGLLGLNPDEDRFRDLQQVLEAAGKASTLTKQLLGFGRRKVIQLQSVDANNVVLDLFNLIRPTIGKLITVKHFPGENAGTVYADPAELQQALLNLCLNSRDAMPNGGMLTIETERVALAEPFPDTKFQIPLGDYVVFSVSDTGCGISRSVQQRMFEPFFTMKEVGKGTGLGLSMVYGMVRQHKGAIRVESEIGAGTKISLYLPSGELHASMEPAEGLGQGIALGTLERYDMDAVPLGSI